MPIKASNGPVTVKNGFIYVEGVRLCKVVSGQIEVKGSVPRRGKRETKFGRCSIEQLVRALGEVHQQ